MGSLFKLPSIEKMHEEVRSKQTKLDLDEWLALMPDDLSLRMAYRTKSRTEDLKFKLLVQLLRRMKLHAYDGVVHDDYNRLEAVHIMIRPLKQGE
jgi:hypothetical protein